MKKALYSTIRLADENAEESWLIEPMVEVLSDLQVRSMGTWQRPGNVARFAVAFGRELDLPNEALLNLHCAAILHDVGKLLVPTEFLNKTAPLDRDEWYSITKHTVAGSKMLKEKTLPAGIISAAQCHHERYDGTGYPLGLVGEDIPFTARILGLADACDAMMSDRPYRGALQPAEMLAEIDNGAGTQFDPALVRKLRPLIKAGILAKMQQGRLRVVSDNPALFRQLWFAARPHGWRIEAWPAEWVQHCPPELGDQCEDGESGAGHTVSTQLASEITIVDGLCVTRLPKGELARIPKDALWIDPLHKVKRSIYTPLDIRDVLGALHETGSEAWSAPIKEKIRVVIADPYHLFRQALRRCLDERDDVEVVAEVATSEDYRTALAKHKFDVAILASDLLAGTHTTAPLQPGDLRLRRNEITTGHLRTQATVVLVADEDVNDYDVALYDAPITGDHNKTDTTCIYIHRGAPAERLVEAMKKLIHDG